MDKRKSESIVVIKKVIYTIILQLFLITFENSSYVIDRCMKIIKICQCSLKVKMFSFIIILTSLKSKHFMFTLMF